MTDWNDVIGEIPKLAQGGHEKFGPELCFMEMVAFLAGEEHGDHPQCADFMLTTFGISLNDGPAAFREALAPVVPMMIGTSTDDLTLNKSRYAHIVHGVIRRIVIPAYSRDLFELDRLNIIKFAHSVGDRNLTIAMELLCEVILGKDDPLGSAVCNLALQELKALPQKYDPSQMAHCAGFARRAFDDGLKLDAPRIAVDILREAIELDPHHKPAEINMERVQVLKELVTA